jgi:hypothetical protein
MYSGVDFADGHWRKLGLHVQARYLAVVFRPLPEKPVLVRRRYLAVVPRPLLAAPLAVSRTCLIVVPRQCGDATLPQQQNGDRQTSRRTE